MGELTVVQIASLLAMALTPFAVLAAGIVSARIHRAHWRALARHLQLANVREYRRLGFVMTIHGERAGFLVQIKEAGNREPKPPIRILADAQGRIPPTMLLRSEDIGTSVAKRFGRKEIEIGNKSFDDAVFIRGPELALQAALDPETRSLVLDLLRSRGRIADGAVYLPLCSEITDTAELASALETVLSVGRRLMDPEDLVARLCERFRQETSPGVRVRLLDLLSDRFPAEARARTVFREALLADSDDLRLRAARVLGDEAREALLAIAARTDGDNRQAVRAIELLGRRLPLDRALELLNDALRASHRSVARAAIQTLGLHGGAAAIERLAVVLAVGDSEPAVAAARALATTGDASAEPPLLGALPAAHPDVAVAVSEALGGVGSTAAVPLLRAMAQNAATDRSVAEAARRAVGAIHARARGAEPGQVSLADDATGQVSLVQEPETGRVSIVDH